MSSDQKKIGRRGFVADGLRILGAVGLGGAACALAARNRLHHGEVWRSGVWQIDPDKCMACGNCQTHCVLDQSAVKAVNCFALCGYCDVCTGYFPTKDFVLDTGAENQLCPTGAITRKFVEEKSGERFFEYTIDEKLCIACGKCVVGCKLMNGSLYLQVRHDRCLHCNECSIAIACPTQAFSRLPADSPGLLKKAAREAEAALARKRAEDCRSSRPARGQSHFRRTKIGTVPGAFRRGPKRHEAARLAPDAGVGGAGRVAGPGGGPGAGARFHAARDPAVADSRPAQRIAPAPGLGLPGGGPGPGLVLRSMAAARGAGCSCWPSPRWPGWGSGGRAACVRSGRSRTWPRPWAILTSPCPPPCW